MSRAIKTPTMIADGGPAFPVNPYRGEVYREAMGMTLRDWFAGQALAGVLANGPYDCGVEGIAQEVYLYADAMLAARESQP